MSESMTEAHLRERTTVSISDKGRIRVPRDMWREMGCPDDDVVVDLVELENGETEVRLR